MSELHDLFDKVIEINEDIAARFLERADHETRLLDHPVKHWWKRTKGPYVSRFYRDAHLMQAGTYQDLADRLRRLKTTTTHDTSDRVIERSLLEHLRLARLVYPMSGGLS